MAEVSTTALQGVIRYLHGCGSQFVESVPVTETFNGETIWEGVVQVFDLVNHPTAERAYAWSHVFEQSGNRRFVVVLHEEPVDSPQTAVRAAVAAEHQNR